MNLLKAGLSTTKMCFIASTLVLCQVEGAVRLEPIGGLESLAALQPDLKVWARDEFTGEEGWKRPIAWFTTHPAELFTLGVDTDGDGQPDEELTGTGEHPFWVEDTQAFMPMRDLRPGMRLSLAQKGNVAIVTGNVSKRGPPGERFTTYNFEVEDFHTYFVGEAGVWVHNRGLRSCEEVFAVWRKLFEHEGGLAKSYKRLLRLTPNMAQPMRQKMVWGLIDDELPKLHQAGKLDARIVQLGSEQGGVFNKVKEAFSAVRYEEKSGRTLRRPTNADIDPTKGEQLGSFDFIDNQGKKWDVVGPTKLGETPELKIQELIDSIIEHFGVPGKGNSLIDLGGLAPAQQRRVMEKVGRMDWKGKVPDWLID